jgi:hypothetical protein
LFGGINIILMGDLLQLKLCKVENRIFEQPISMSAETYFWEELGFFEN